MRSRFFDLATILFIGDAVLTQLALLLGAVMRYVVPLGKPLGPTEPELIVYTPLLHLFVLFIWPAVFVSLNLYDERQANRLFRQPWALLVATTAATFAFAGVLYFSFRDVPRIMVIYFYVLDLVLLFAFRLVLERVWRREQIEGQGALKLLVVGANEMGRTVAEAIRAELGAACVRIGFLDDEPTAAECAPLLGSIQEARTVVTQHAIDEVIIALPLAQHDRVEPLLLDLQTLPVHISIVPDQFRLAMVRASVDQVAGIPLIGVREPLIHGANRLLKRAFDLLVSSLTLALAWPCLLIIAVAIKLDSAGPVIFKQERVGENGRLFWMYKFRTMTTDAEKNVPCTYVADENGCLQPVYKTPCDPRVTRVGRVLRRFSLDELPQLINVIRGEMSLVGPRPEQTFIVEQYQPWQRQRLVVPPGITGWWQVSGRSDLPMHLNTEYDLFYIRNYSLWLDIVILLRTLGAVIVGRGAY